MSNITRQITSLLRDVPHQPQAAPPPENPPQTLRELAAYATRHTGTPIPADPAGPPPPSNPQ